ncbi:MAG: hypothetical protein LBK95_03900 [Bifidobacteriaceae bacterium]|nr:hypothetical protein [Bifidobacteriaceae bacterium]
MNHLDRIEVGPGGGSELVLAGPVDRPQTEGEVVIPCGLVGHAVLLVEYKTGTRPD